MPARRASHGRLERLVHHVVGASGGAPARPLTQQRRDYKLDTQYRQRMDELGLVVPEEFRALYHTAEGLAREDIGRIQVRDSFSLVELPEEGLERLLGKLKDTRVGGKQLKLRRYRED